MNNENIPKNQAEFEANREKLVSNGWTMESSEIADSPNNQIFNPDRFYAFVMPKTDENMVIYYKGLGESADSIKDELAKIDGAYGSVVVKKVVVKSPRDDFGHGEETREFEQLKRADWDK